jgi:hypothetical protein
MNTMSPAMNKLTRADLWPLERYAEERKDFRDRVIAHKKLRNVPLGEHISLLFEDRLTVQYQVQEMLRIERIFEAAGIQDELDAYNPLIPDGSNLKATMLIEFPDAGVRAERLAQLGGIEHRVFAEVEGQPRVFAHADEDLDRSTDDKTSAVHFLRFEFPSAAIAALRNGAALGFGIEDPRLPERVVAPVPTRLALIDDFGH